MGRIEFNDSFLDIIYKMSEGNPGAVNVMMMLFQNKEEIDPQSALGGFGAILSLDTHEIYGSNIWVFYKDVCGQDLETMIGCERAVQLGLRSSGWLKNMINCDREARHITEAEREDIILAVSEVKKILPKFGDKSKDQHRNET